jgi:hypothetical protein
VSTTTDETGRYTLLGLDDGTYTLTFKSCDGSSSDFVTQTATVDVQTGGGGTGGGGTGGTGGGNGDGGSGNGSDVPYRAACLCDFSGRSHPSSGTLTVLALPWLFLAFRLCAKKSCK